MEKSSSAAEMFTPEALRAASRSSLEPAPTRPGERSPTKSSSSVAKPPSKMRGKLRRCGHTLSFVPWWALLSLGLLVGGITLMAIKGPAAADAADVLLGQLSSDTGTGYPKYMSIYSTSVWVTVGVAGAGVAALILGASVRLDQRLRKAGKYGQAKGSYGPLLFKFYSFLDWMGLILMTLLALWAVVIGVMLASWASQCWNLEQGAAVASANMAALDDMASKYTQNLNNFAAAVMAAAGGTTAAQLNSIKSFGIQQAGAPAPAPVAQPAATPSPVAAPEEASAPAPAAGQVSAASMDTAPTTAPINTTTPTAPTTGTVTEKLNITVYSALATLQLYASNLTEVTSPSTVWQESGLCPSAACLNMAMYPFTESSACVCTKDGVQSVATLAGECKDATVWALIGVAGLCAGAMFAAMELAVDTVLLSADQLFLRVIKRKSSRSSSRGSARKSGEEPSMSMSKREMASPSMPRGGSYPYLVVNATATT